MADWMTRLGRTLNGERARILDMSLKMTLLMGRLAVDYGLMLLDATQKGSYCMGHKHRWLSGGSYKDRKC